MPTSTKFYSLKEYDEMVVEKNKKYNELLQEYTIFKNQDHLIKDIYEKDQKITNPQKENYRLEEKYRDVGLALAEIKGSVDSKIFTQYQNKFNKQELITIISQLHKALNKEFSLESGNFVIQRIEYKKAKDYLIVLKQQLNELKEFKSVFWMKLCGCDDPNEDELNLENMSEIVCNIHNILKDIHNLTGLINVNHQFI